MMDAVDIDRIERAQECLGRVQAQCSEVGVSSLADELIHHLDMMLRVITSVRLMSGELDDVELVLTPRARALSRTSNAH
jgi:hypothetical protein